MICKAPGTVIDIGAIEIKFIVIIVITFNQNMPIFNNNFYSLSWRRIGVDICQAAKRQGKYTPLFINTEVNNNYCFSIYHTS